MQTYCNALYKGHPLRLTQRLQRVQNVMARLVAGVHIFNHISPVLAHLHWLTESWRIGKQRKLVTKRPSPGLCKREYLPDRTDITIGTGGAGCN